MLDKRPHPGHKGDPISLASPSVGQAAGAIFRIKPADVKGIVAGLPMRWKGRGSRGRP